jgi:hypothetical protein
MKKTILLIVLTFTLILAGKAQSSSLVFDSADFNQKLAFANHLAEYEFYTQETIKKFRQQEDISTIEWFSFRENNTWHTVGGNVADNKLTIIHHITFDSLSEISDYTGISDTSQLNSYGLALASTNIQFKSIRDTTSIYFNSFVISNPNQTISIWMLPALQPSGQAIYGCEWEYIFDKTGKNLLKKNSFTNILTGVWIGQPRELWLNYRNTDQPTIGSLFFTQSFRDYFTRIRIDTKTSTSTTTKNKYGNYTWTHKMK